MATRENAKRYMNLMAAALKIVDIFPGAYNEIFAIKCYETSSEFVRSKMDSFWSDNDEQFLDKIEDFLNSIETEVHKEHQSVMAMEFCRWLDFRITYMQKENNEDNVRQYFSLYSLIPLYGDNFVKIGSLNTNWEDTGIWINPKFGIASPYVIRKGEKIEKKVANRDVFEGINGDLNNCSYTRWNGKNMIKNIVISNEFLLEKPDNVLRIAFAPLSDSSDLIQTEEKNIKRYGNFSFKGEVIKPIDEADTLYQRLKDDWILASDNQADIFFAPELLGTEMSEKNDGLYNEMILRLSHDRLADGKSVPKVTILPSYWHNNCNSATIVNCDGQIITSQEKHIPFVDKKNGTVEALADLNEWSTVIIHIPNVHRIAIMICAEFLAKEVQHLQEYICGSLGATLVLVPSYSRGEQDFINALSSLKCYGTTVIWGNCCGAIVNDEKGIGGCGIAGTIKTAVFGSKCSCDFSCSGITACVFQIDLPLDFNLKKTNNLEEFNGTVKHIIQR